MHILGLVAEDFKKLRVVEITPKGHLVQITGKNGQGKTSVLDAIWAGLVGKRATPEKPVRKGAQSAKIHLNLGDVIVTRTIGGDGNQKLTVTNADGIHQRGPKDKGPQELLDSLLGELTFDPLEFIGMKPKQQIEVVRRIAKIDLDVDSLNAANKTDYDERTGINREIERLKAEMATITVQEKLPKAKIDEAAILAKIAQVDSINAAARKHDDAKREANQNLAHFERALKSDEDELAERKAQVAALEKQIQNSKEILQKKRTEADELPDGVYASAAELTEELNQAQLVNREIDKRSRRDVLQGQLNAKTHHSDQLTRQIKDREEQKRVALDKAQMPVEGLTFDEEIVTYKGIPIEQLGDAEKIRVSTSIAMAANPKLKVIRILHGEALDEDSLVILAQMAEQHDYQIWMARVDSTGKVGIIMEDGMVKAGTE